MTLSHNLSRSPNNCLHLSLTVCFSHLLAFPPSPCCFVAFKLVAYFLPSEPILPFFPQPSLPHFLQNNNHPLQTTCIHKVESHGTMTKPNETLQRYAATKATFCFCNTISKQR